MVLMFISWFLIAMSSLEREIEQVNFNKTVSEMNASLTLTFYQYVSNGDLNNLQTFHQGNPFIFLAENNRLPANYHGEIQLDEEMIKGGWYFNVTSRDVTYKPNSDVKVSRLKLEFRYKDLNQSGEFEHAFDEIKYFKLVKQ